MLFLTITLVLICLFPVPFLLAFGLGLGVATLILRGIRFIGSCCWLVGTLWLRHFAISALVLCALGVVIAEVDSETVSKLLIVATVTVYLAACVAVTVERIRRRSGSGSITEAYDENTNERALPCAREVGHSNHESDDSQESLLDESVRPKMPQGGLLLVLAILVLTAITAAYRSL